MDPNVYQGPGNGGTHHALVNIAAEGCDNTGAANSSVAQAALWFLIATASGQGAWYPNGTYLFSTPQTCPSNTRIECGPGVTLNQQLVGGHVTPQTAWLYAVGTQRGTATGSIATTPTYYVDNPTVSVNLATKPLVNGYLNFAAAGASKGGNQLYQVSAVAGAVSPWTVTLTRPIVFPFVAGDTVIEYSAATRHIQCAAGEALGSGTGDQQWEFAYGDNIHVERMRYNSTLGAVTIAVGGFDVGLVSCEATDCEADCTAIPFGYYSQSNERTVFRRMRVKSPTTGGVALYDCFSSGVVDSWVYGVTGGGATGILLGSLGTGFGGNIGSYVQGGGVVNCYNGIAVRDGSSGCFVSDMSVIGCAANGVYIGASGTSKTLVVNVSSTYNTAAGFIVLSEAQLKNIDFSHNSNAGGSLRIDPGAGNLVSVDGGTCDQASTEAQIMVGQASGIARLKNLRLTSAVAGGQGIYNISGTRMECDGCNVLLSAGGGARSFQVDAGILTLTNCVATGAGGVYGVYVTGGTLIIGPNCDFSSCAVAVGITGGVVEMYQGGVLPVAQAAGSQTFSWTQADTIVTSGTSGSIVINMAIPNLKYLVDNTAASGTATIKASAGDAGIGVATGKSAWVKVNAAGTAMVRVTADT